jgi:hypothetical protein
MRASHAPSAQRCAIPTCSHPAAIVLTVERPVDVDLYETTFAEYAEYVVCPFCAESFHFLLDGGHMPGTEIVEEKPVPVIPTQREGEQR